MVGKYNRVTPKSLYMRDLYVSGERLHDIPYSSFYLMDYL